MSHAFTTADAAPYLQPMKVGDFTIRNRILYSPCTRNRGNIPGKRQVIYYRARAKAGLIVSEGALPSPQGYEYANAPGIYTKKQVAGWKAITNAVHEEGGVIFCQVMHIGRVANPLFQAAQAPIAPSAIKANCGGHLRQTKAYWVSPGHDVVEMAGDFAVPEAIEDISEVLAEYRRAFENAKLAGFDGTELHCGNGYLLSQFLDHSSNQRTDEYGGSAEKRCRFVLEVLAIAIEVFGSAGRVGVKITPSGGYNDQGMPLEDALATYGYLLKQLDQQKIAYVELQRWILPFDPVKRGTIIPCSTWRQFFSGPLFLNGSISLAEGAQLINAGSADGIIFGRYFMSTPDLVERVEHALPLNEFDRFTAFSSGDAGYNDLKTWAEQTEEERAETTKKYDAYLAEIPGELKMSTDLYLKQEADAGRVPGTLYSI